MFEKDAPYRPVTSSRKSDELLAIVEVLGMFKDR
jgi:hypothetical protein